MARKEPPPAVPSYGLVEGGDPFARKSTQVSTDYPGWTHAPLSPLQEQWQHLRHWDQAFSDGYGEKNEVERGHWRDQRNVEHVLVADEGNWSTTPSPDADGKLPYDPRNNAPNRAHHDPAMYTFLADRHERPELNGYKLTLADHLHLMPIGAMRPQYRRDMQNTYRLEPEPWDMDQVLLPDTVRTSTPLAHEQQYNQLGSNRSFRLGG